MTIQIDDRETSLIKEYVWQNIPHEVKHLPVGDLVLGNCVIERKTGTDFVASLCDGRLKEQSQNMLHNYKRAFIVVEGKLPTDFNIRSALGMMASIVARYNIPIINVGSIYETAYLSWRILEKANDGKAGNFDVVRTSKHKDKRLDILTLVEGVSLEKAKNIVEKYPLFKNLVEADVEKLKNIDGIGSKIAHNIHSFFSIFRY